MKGLYLEDLTFREFFDWLKKEKIDLFELKELVLQQGRRKYASIDDWMKEVEQSVYTLPYLEFARSVNTREEIDEIHRVILQILRRDKSVFMIWEIYKRNIKKAIAELWENPSVSLPVLEDIYRAYLMMNILEADGKLNEDYLNLMWLDV